MGVGVGAGEEIVYSNKSSSSSRLVTGEERALISNKKRKGKWGSLKECNISRHEVTSKSGTVTHIPLLNSRVTKEDNLK